MRVPSRVLQSSADRSHLERSVGLLVGIRIVLLVAVLVAAPSSGQPTPGQSTPGVSGPGVSGPGASGSGVPGPEVSLPGRATPVREADAACARCHGEIFRSYLATPMANASGVATDGLRPGGLRQRAAGVDYEISLDRGRAILTAGHPGGPSPAGGRPLSYFLGSGHLGTTYLYSIGDYLFESPIAWYAASRGYDMKPGLAEMRQAPPPLPMESGCLRCHMSAVRPSDAGTMNRFSALPFLHLGITCEACHGDSGEHAASGGKAPVVNPARLDPDRRDSICISCHLEGDVSVERAGRSALSYRPGESISDYLAYYVRGGASLTARGVSEVEQLRASRCRQVSGDRMSCMSCHDPHSSPDAAQRTEFFRGRCLSCHNEPRFAGTHHPENRDCTGCHMPRSAASNILHVAWTDHRIRRVPDQLPAGEDRAGDPLVPVLSPGATDRDLAMASYQLLLEGDRSFESLAWHRLDQLGASIANDPAALNAVGNLAAERGEREAAERAFRRVLTLVPDDLTALSNLAVLEARKGELREAVSLLARAFARNKDVPGLALNLARVECMAGEGEAARQTISDALTYAPDLSDLLQLQSRIGTCTESSPQGRSR